MKHLKKYLESKKSNEYRETIFSSKEITIEVGTVSGLFHINITFDYKDFYNVMTDIACAASVVLDRHILHYNGSNNIEFAKLLNELRSIIIPDDSKDENLIFPSDVIYQLLKPWSNYPIRVLEKLPDKLDNIYGNKIFEIVKKSKTFGDLMDNLIKLRKVILKDFPAILKNLQLEIDAEKFGL